MQNTRTIIMTKAKSSRVILNPKPAAVFADNICASGAWPKPRVATMLGVFAHLLPKFGLPGPAHCPKKRVKPLLLLLARQPLPPTAQLLLLLAKVIA